MEYGQRIKALEKSLNLTQKQFAQVLGIHHSYVSDLERNKKPLQKTLLYFIKLRYGDNFGLEGAQGRKTELNPHLKIWGTPGTHAAARKYAGGGGAKTDNRRDGKRTAAKTAG